MLLIATRILRKRSKRAVLFALRFAASAAVVVQFLATCQYDAVPNRQTIVWIVSNSCVTKCCHHTERNCF